MEQLISRLAQIFLPSEIEDKDLLEKLFLASVLEYPYWLEENINNIKEELFTGENRKILVKIIEGYTKQRLVTREDIEAFFGPLPTPSQPPDEYYNKLLEIYYRTKVNDILRNFLNKVNNNEENIEKNMRDLVFEIEELLHLKDSALERATTSLKQTLSQTPKILKIHPILDKMWGSGSYLGEVYYLVARPKQGKSFFLIWLALQMLYKGIPIFYLNMELTPRAFWERFISFYYKKNYMNTGEDLRKIITKELLHLVEPMSIIHHPIDIMELEQVYRLAYLKGVKAILIDQLSHISLPLRYTGDFFGRFPSLVHLITQFSKKYEIFTFILSQLNREGKLAYSDEIAKSADLVYIMDTQTTVNGFTSTIKSLYSRRVPPHDFSFTLNTNDFEVNVMPLESFKDLTDQLSMILSQEELDEREREILEENVDGEGIWY